MLLDQTSMLEPMQIKLWKMRHFKGRMAKKNRYHSTAARGTPPLLIPQRTVNLKPNIPEVLLLQENAIGPLLCLLVVLSRVALSRCVTPATWSNFLSAQLQSRDHTNKLKLNARQKGETFGLSLEA